MKASIDFDGTLTIESVQKFVKKLIKNGHEVWIVTSRFSTDIAKIKGWDWIERQNDQLFAVADELDINVKNIHFTNMESKINFLAGRHFDFHLDDDADELINIRISSDKCVPMNVGLFEWEELLTRQFNL